MRVALIIMFGLLCTLTGCVGDDSTVVVNPPVEPPVTPPTASCSNLGTPGVWQQVQPSGYGGDYRVAAFVIENGVIYLGTDSYNDGNSYGIQRSADCAATWTHVSTGTGADAVNGGRQWTFASSGQTLYTNSGYYQGGIWKSLNSGADWVNVTPTVDGAPGFAGYLSMDPTDPQHLFVTWHEPCRGLQNQYGWEDQVGCFHETKDGGATWKGHYSTGTKWPNEHRAVILHGATFLVLDENLLRTTNGGLSYSVVPGGSLSGHSSGLLSRDDDGNLYLGTEDGIFRSTQAQDGAQWANVGGRWVGEIADAGAKLYATQMQGPLLESSNGITWTDAPGSPSVCERIRYDSIHKALYASCGAGGLWRLVMP